MDGKNGSHDLTARALGGSAEAFGSLIERHYRSVFAIAYCRVQRWEIAEDLAQDTFLTAWQHRASLRDPDKFHAWTMQIARNLSRNWLRSDTYRRQLAERAEAEAAAPDTGAPQEKVAIMGEWDDAVDKAIAALPENMREAVVLYYLHEESAEETGRLLGISAAAVRKRTQRARELMRVYLEKDWESALAARSKALPVRQRAARVSALLALPPVSAPLAKAAAVEAASTIATAGAGVSATTGVWIGAGFLAAVGVLVAFAIPILRDASTGDEVPAMTVADAPDVQPASAPADPDSTALTGDAATAPVPAAVETGDATAAVVANATVETDVEVEPPVLFSLTGEVIDASGNAVRGALVNLTPSDYRQAWSTGVSKQVRQAVSDGGGQFYIDDINAGSYRLAASMDGYSDSQPQTIRLEPTPVGRGQGGSATTSDGSGSAADMHYTLVLDVLEGAELYAQVLGKDGRPLAHAIVDCRGFVSEHGARAGSSNVTVTDGNGNVSIDLPGLGMATLIVRGQSGEQVVVRDVPVDPENRVPVPWPETASLEGTISGDGAAGAVARLESRLRMQSFNEEGRATSTATTSGPTYEALIAPSGAYRIDSISVDLEYTFAIVDAEKTYLTPKIPMPAFEAGKTARFDYTLSELTHVAGTVRGSVSNRPLRDLMVKWQSLDDPSLADMKFVDENGQFEFDLRVAEGRYAFQAAYRTNNAALDARYIHSVSITPGTDMEVDLIFPDPVTRTIFVVDESGTPIEDANVSYCQGHSSWGWGLQTDASGKAAYGGVVPGDVVHFEVDKRGYVTVNSAAFAGNPGDVFDPETVVLVRE